MRFERRTTDGVRDAHTGRVVLNERQQSILRALADSNTSLETCELRRRVALYPTALRTACVWLLNHHYIERQRRRVRRSVLGGTAMQVIAFWQLTEKGHAFVRAVHLPTPSKDDGACPPLPGLVD